MAEWRRKIVTRARVSERGARQGRVKVKPLSQNNVDEQQREGEKIKKSE
jgi:hypothetical protein